MDWLTWHGLYTDAHPGERTTVVIASSLNAVARTVDTSERDLPASFYREALLILGTPTFA